MHAPSAPGALIGYRKNGRPIYLMAGGSGEGDPAPAPEATPPTPEPPKPTPPPAEAKPATERVEDLPDWAQKLIKDTRKESGDYRVKAKEHETVAEQAKREREEVLDRIAKAAGFKDDDSAPDPEQLTKQLTAAQEQAQQREQELRTMRVERAAEKAARTHGADVDTLLDSRSFAQKLADLDPSATDFSDAVNALVEKAVADNPKFKVAQAATSSSADFSSGPGEKRTHRPTSLYDAIDRTVGG